MIPLRFTPHDAERAWEAWGANCGPCAIAAICGLTLDEVRPHLGDFEAKRYTNPTLMSDTLTRLEKAVGTRFWRKVRGDLSWPAYGLARIQWEGPWTQPGVPMRARYRHTHWVGANGRDPRNVGIWDVNALGNGTGWCSLEDWSDTLVPHILRECVPRADGRWHLTHVIEVDAERLRREAEAA